MKKLAHRGQFFLFTDEIVHANLKEYFKNEIPEHTYTNTEEFFEKLNQRKLLNWKLGKQFGWTKEDCDKNEEWKAEASKQ